MLIDTNKNASEILKKLNLNNIVIDSFTISIELEKVKIVSENVNSEIVSFYEKTGKITETQKSKGVPVHFHGLDSGAKIYFKIKKESRKKAGGGYRKQEYAQFLIYSKLLGCEYFEGITSENIKHIYDILTSETHASEKIFDFDYETFLNARATDIDYKVDSIVNANFSEIIRTFEQLKKRKFTAGKKIDNEMIQFSKRSTTKTRTEPFLKIYNKNLELMYESRAFYDNFLERSFGRFLDRNTILRLETTIKNKQHLQRIFTSEKKNTLFEILNLTDSEKDKIMSDALKTCIDIDNEPIEKPKKRKSSDMKRSDAFCYLYVISRLEMNEPLEIIIKKASKIYHDKRKSYEMKKQIETIYHEFCENTKADKKMKKVNKQLEFVFRFLR